VREGRSASFWTGGRDNRDQLAHLSKKQCNTPSEQAKNGWLEPLVFSFKGHRRSDVFSLLSANLLNLFNYLRKINATAFL
jgi:hypothetical protein